MNSEWTAAQENGNKKRKKEWTSPTVQELPLGKTEGGKIPKTYENAFFGYVKSGS